MTGENGGPVASATLSSTNPKWTALGFGRIVRASWPDCTDGHPGRKQLSRSGQLKHYTQSNTLKEALYWQPSRRTGQVRTDKLKWTRHEDLWGCGGIPPRILTLGTGWRWELRFTYWSLCPGWGGPLKRFECGCENDICPRRESKCSSPVRSKVVLIQSFSNAHGFKNSQDGRDIGQLSQVFLQKPFTEC